MNASFGQDHNCDFDHKGKGREILAKNNPNISIKGALVVDRTIRFCSVGVWSSETLLARVPPWSCSCLLQVVPLRCEASCPGLSALRPSGMSSRALDVFEVEPLASSHASLHLHLSSQDQEKRCRALHLKHVVMVSSLF